MCHAALASLGAWAQVPQRNTKAYSYCEKAITGDAAAQASLGYEYEKQNDYASAVYWYRKAAAQDYARAQYHIGVCHQFGNGVTKSITEAVKWYRKAAEQGYAGAQCNLGLCYEYGQGVTKSITEAVKWYRKAAAQGDSDAKENLKRLGYSE